jgi:hypothetical protein
MSSVDKITDREARLPVGNYRSPQVRSDPSGLVHFIREPV